MLGLSSSGFLWNAFTPSCSPLLPTGMTCRLEKLPELASLKREPQHPQPRQPQKTTVSPTPALLGQASLLGPHTYPGFLDLSQFSRASLLKAAVAAMLLLFSWMLAMVSECSTTSMRPVRSPVGRQP